MDIQERKKSFLSWGGKKKYFKEDMDNNINNINNNYHLKLFSHIFNPL